MGAGGSRPGSAGHAWCAGIVQACSGAQHHLSQPDRQDKGDAGGQPACLALHLDRRGADPAAIHMCEGPRSLLCAYLPRRQRRKHTSGLATAGGLRRGSPERLVVLGAKAGAGPEQQRVNPCGPRPQGTGYLCRGESADLSHRQGSPLARGQPAQRHLHGILLLGGQGHGLGRSPAPHIGVGLGHHVAQLRLRQPCAPPACIPRQVHHDPREPWAECLSISQA